MLNEFWGRCAKIEGSYIVEKTENVDAFFKATGDTMLLQHLVCQYL
jgi:hypothetical protein